MNKHLFAATLALACKSGAPSDTTTTTTLPLSTTRSGSSTAPSGGRDYMNIVGSSTVYPFSTVVAEQFGNSTRFKTPKVESTGSGGGLKLFCGGVGVEHPDIANSSRRIKQSEVAECARNGVTDIVELKVGYDGIVVANAKNQKPLSITLRQLWLALAKQVPSGDGEKQAANPYQKWSEIDPELPASNIEVLGPPPTSGTRDAFLELALEPACSTFESLAALKLADERRYKKLCHTLREDGRFIEAGENDNLIVQKLNANPQAFGIFGFSFLDQNSDKVQPATVDGVAPTFDSISDGSYPISRPLYIYVKKAHAHVIPGIVEYIAEFTSPRAWGPDGYLAGKGMIPMPDEERARFRDAALALTPLRM